MNKIKFTGNKMEFTKAVEDLLVLLKEWLKENKNAGMSEIGVSEIMKEVGGCIYSGCFVQGIYIRFFVNFFKDYPELEHVEGDECEFTFYINFPWRKVKTEKEYMRAEKKINKILTEAQDEVGKIIENSNLPLTKTKYRPRYLLSSAIPYFLDRLYLLR